MTNLLSVVVFILISILVSGIVSEDRRPEITIENGLLRGVYMKSRNDRVFSAYLGVPYAQPPVGDLRFKNPVPSLSWSRPFEANNDSRFCLQLVDFVKDPEPTVGQEDCLYLNVYTPKTQSADNKKYPVMFSIHYGSWVFGSGTSDMYAPNYLLDHDIVLVSPNYRLGPLGFLSTEDENCPGNFGLKDQQLALKWVQKNIEYFGGDPNSVTVFGTSAGSASVEYQLYSKESRGLFHRVITQSGSVFNGWAQNYLNNARDLAVIYGKALNCSTLTTAELISCLRNKDAKDLIEKSKFPPVFDMGPDTDPYGPVVEPNINGAFLTESPITLMEKGDVIDVPTITGYTSGEGAYRSIVILSNETLLKELDKNRKKNFPHTFLYHATTNQTDQITEKIVKRYFGDKPIDVSTAQELTNAYSDSVILNGVEISKRLHQAYMKSPLYIYYFGYRGKYSTAGMFGDFEMDLGVSHGDELIYLFPLPKSYFPDTSLTSDDYKMVDILTKLWTNFAKFGTPTPKLHNELGFEWTVNTKRIESDVLQIHSPINIQMGKNPLQDNVDFWLNMPYNVIYHDKLKKAKLLSAGTKNEL